MSIKTKLSLIESDHASRLQAEGLQRVANGLRTIIIGTLLLLALQAIPGLAKIGADQAAAAEAQEAEWDNLLEKK